VSLTQGFSRIFSPLAWEPSIIPKEIVEAGRRKNPGKVMVRWTIGSQGLELRPTNFRTEVPNDEISSYGHKDTQGISCETKIPDYATIFFILYGLENCCTLNCKPKANKHRYSKK
jgi:hypothetical protein